MNEIILIINCDSTAAMSAQTQSKQWELTELIVSSDNNKPFSA